jgi:hypothetical protein
VCAHQGSTSWQINAKQYNPDFYGCNQVFIKYCSSDLHTGMMTGPTAATWGLQFSGFNIVKAVLDTLNASSAYGLAQASLVVWSGDSAGGIGAVALVDYVRDYLPAHVRVVGAPIGFV